MMNNVRVGDYFYFSGNNFSVIGVNRIQFITSINVSDDEGSRRIYSRFLDDDSFNSFQEGSIYFNQCIKVDDVRNFGIGDKIRYMGDDDKLGVQEIIEVHYFFNELDEITTRNCFGGKNRFDYDSVYGRRCVMVYYGSGGFKTEYDNGIPVVWGDEL